jgi:hypothetical protein
MKWRPFVVGGIVGLIVPLVVVVYHLSTKELAGFLTVLVWPSSLMLMGTEGMSGSGAHVVLAEAIVINVVLYAILGWIVGRLLRRKSKRDKS